MDSEELPFSFVYGGRRSSELIGKWKRTVQEEAIDAGKAQRIVTLSDPETKLEVRAVFTVFTDTPGVDWTLYLTNRGDKDTPVIEQLRAVDTTVKQSGDVTLHRIVGSPCRVDDWLPLSDALPAGKRIEFAPEGGRSSSPIAPFFDLQWPGGGVITAIGWSGQWCASVERMADDRLRIQAGMQQMRLKLHPGETIRSPRIMQVYWFGDDPWRGYNLFRRAMFAHVMPRIEGQLVVPPITTNSPWVVHQGDVWKYINGFKEADAFEEIKYIKGLGLRVLLGRCLLHAGQLSGRDGQLRPSA